MSVTTEHVPAALTTSKHSIVDIIVDQVCQVLDHIINIV